ncbi:hypothetical protein BA953_16600 [Vibrio coralliilyticus]|uniref:hypothetical protein n=1 Tax=Vibrio coralliilyticus TaxID=190893 RepID=UPI0008104E32|nr:hypothetical protein [Vibrio coralliilyticus]ANW25816.1 hypothetical protein BA953_16600 [Vibrio coralliilyticus]
MILQPGEVKRISVARYRWLIVREASDYFFVQSDNSERTRIDAGDKLNIDELSELDLSNPRTTETHVVYQLTEREIETTPPVNLKVADAMAVTEVRTIVNTREVSPQSFTSSNHVEILPGHRKRLCQASASRKELIVQNISVNECEATLGGQTVSAVNGLSILGDRQAPGGMTLNGGGELWAFNNGSGPLKLAVLEVHN